MKLTQRKLFETLRRKNEGWTTYQARKIAGISVRRVNQVWGDYIKTRQIPEIGKNNGRPRKPVQEWETKMVKEAGLSILKAMGRLRSGLRRWKHHSRRLLGR